MGVGGIEMKMTEAEPKLRLCQKRQKTKKDGVRDKLLVVRPDVSSRFKRSCTLL